MAKSVANVILNSPQIVATATRMADVEEAILSSPRIMAFGKQVAEAQEALLNSPQIVATATRMADVEEAILSSPRIMAFGKQVAKVEEAILSSSQLTGLGDWVISALPRFRNSFERGWIQDVLSELEVDLVPVPDFALPDPGAEEREPVDLPILSAKDRWIILVLGGAILYSILIRMHGLGQLESMGKETIELTMFLLETLKTLADEIPALGGLLVFFAIAGGVKTLKAPKNE